MWTYEINLSTHFKVLYCGWSKDTDDDTMNISYSNTPP